MKRRIKLIARVTLLAFLLNAILPFFAVYNLQDNRAFAAEMASLFGEKVLICTGDGFKWVSWQELQNGKEKQHNSSHYQCALCYVAAHGLKDTVMPDAITLANVETGGSRYAIYDYYAGSPHLHASLYRRAPPSISFS